MNKSQYPPGWDNERVSKVLAHYENQTEEEQYEEIQAAPKEQKITSKEYEKIVADIAGGVIEPAEPGRKQKFKASARLEDVVFEKDAGGISVLLNLETITDVVVGWRPGP